MSKLVHYLCIGCPLGCQLEVEDEDGQVKSVSGYSCRRGDEFARQEHVDPRRMVTTTVRVENGELARVPVKTTRPVAKKEMAQICAKLHALTLSAPVKIGDVVLQNACGDGVDVVATRQVEAVTHDSTGKVRETVEAGHIRNII